MGVIQKNRIESPGNKRNQDYFRSQNKFIIEEPTTTKNTTSRIMMDAYTTNSNTSANQVTQREQKRVRFGDNMEFEAARSNDDDSSTHNTWLDEVELKLSFRADVIAFLTECKRSQEKMMDWGQQEVNKSFQEYEEAQETVCARGLEMYYPGQYGSRRQMRNMFSSHMLLKSRQLKLFYQPDVANEILRQFASALGENAQKRAHALAMQDALEAQSIYAEEDESALSASSKDTISSLDLFPFIRRGSKTTQSTCKARAA